SPTTCCSTPSSGSPRTTLSQSARRCSTTPRFGPTGSAKRKSLRIASPDRPDGVRANVKQKQNLGRVLFVLSGLLGSAAEAAGAPAAEPSPVLRNLYAVNQS